MGVITFNGKTSTSVGLQVERQPDYDIAEQEYESIHVPGRNGDVLMATGSFKNSIRTYQVSFGEENGNFATLVAPVAAWLTQGPGYLRLEDSYTPDYFMLATCSEAKSILNILGQAGRATINFNRQPQRFLKTGASPKTITAATAFVNPTQFDSKPLIRISGNGTGTVTVGTYTISVTNLSAYMDIDCELQDAFKGAINMNNYVTLSKGFPVLPPGSTNISFSGGVTSVTVTPRWWTI